MSNKKFRGSFIEVRGEDGSVIKIRTNQINLVQIPPSRLALGPKDIPNVLVLVGDTQMHFPVPMGEAISQMLDELDKENADRLRATRQDVQDLNGLGPSRN